jgi:hypothetical protein
MQVLLRGVVGFEHELNHCVSVRLKVFQVSNQYVKGSFAKATFATSVQLGRRKFYDLWLSGGVGWLSGV